MRRVPVWLDDVLQRGGDEAGNDLPDQEYIVGAHYDSVSNPGADDNASGVALVLEAARILSQYDSAYTIRFIAFDREEQGLHGSSAYASAHAGDNILGMVNLDMIAYNPDGANKNKVRLYDYIVGGAIKSDLITAFDTYGSGVVAVDSGQNGQSDHRPFEQQGFDAAVEMIQNSTGRFVFEPGGEPVQRSIDASVTEVILEASRIEDEAAHGTAG